MTSTEQYYKYMDMEASCANTTASEWELYKGEAEKH